MANSVDSDQTDLDLHYLLIALCPETWDFYGNCLSGLDDLSAAELELVVLCKLEQAEIAQLKHHAPMAARVVLSSLKLLQGSNIFRKKREVPVQRRLVFAWKIY